jgi:hypothetical protein
MILEIYREYSSAPALEVFELNQIFFFYSGLRGGIDGR